MKFTFRPWALRLIISAAATFFLSLSAHAQTSANSRPSAGHPQAATAATLEGTVFDPSGRVVPAARVTLLSALTVLAERQTDTRGEYRFAGLRGGVFTLVANQPGFSTSSSEVQLATGETRRVDLHLVLSAVPQQVVVSASPGGALEPQIGSSVSVVPHHESDERGAQSLLEVLRGVPGVEVNQSGRRGGVTGVFIRGGNSNYNLVLIDGIQVNEFGGAFDFAPLAVDGVDHVEVIRGPQSALYGSNAVTGVINVVTERGEGPPHFSALAEGGSFTTRRLAGGGSGLAHGFGWALNLSRLDSGGVVPNDEYRNQAAILNFSFPQIPRRQFTFHFYGDANDAGAPGPFGSDPLHVFPGIDSVSRDKQNLVGYQASYAEQFSNHFRQVTTLSVSTNRFLFHSPFGDSFSHDFRAAGNTRGEITVSAKDLLVVGFEVNREQIKNTFIADANNVPFLLRRTSYAYFVENRWNPTRRWFVTTGVRVDNIRTDALSADSFAIRPLLPASSVVQANPRLSTAYLAHESDGGGWFSTTRLHGSFGTGIRAPNGFELAFTNNPQLKPEKSISFDLGAEQRLFGSRAVLDLTYFYNRFKDQIVVLGGSLQNLSSFASDNLANARAQGVEVSFRIQAMRSLELAGEYTRLNSTILALNGASVAPSPFRVGQPLIRRPRNSAGYNVTWSHHQLMLNLNGYVRGSVLDVEPNFGAVGGLFRNKGYVLANAGFAYTLAAGFEIYGRLNNFLNQKYEESFGFPSLHLNFLAGVKFRFPTE